MNIDNITTKIRFVRVKEIYKWIISRLFYCPYHENCSLFRESSITCVQGGGDYCGKYRDVRDERIRKFGTLSRLLDLRFKRPVKFTIYERDGFIYCENEKYAIYASGRNKKDMLIDLYNTISDTIKILNDPNIVLADGSKKYIKKFLNEFVVT